MIGLFFQSATEKVRPEEATAENFDDFSSKSVTIFRQKVKNDIKKGLNTISIARTAFVVCKLQKLSKIYVQSVAHSVLSKVNLHQTDVKVLEIIL